MIVGYIETPTFLGISFNLNKLASSTRKLPGDLLLSINSHICCLPQKLMNLSVFCYTHAFTCVEDDICNVYKLLFKDANACTHYILSILFIVSCHNDSFWERLSVKMRSK